MSNIFLPGSLTQWPYLNTDFHYFNPSRVFTPANYMPLNECLSYDMRNKIRFGYYTQTSATYPRFDPEDFLYKIKPNPIYNILPDVNPRLERFSDIADARAIEIEKLSEKVSTVYLFWSGGIDSTTILVSILKNCSAAFLSKVVVVVNSYSIAEFPNMYYGHVHKKLAEVSTDEFLSGNIVPNNNSIYLTGDVGDPIFGFDDIVGYDSLFPNSFNTPWKKQIDNLISFFNRVDDTKGVVVCQAIIDSLAAAQIEVDTVYDFLWWTNFNWGHDIDLFHNWIYGVLPETINGKKFVEENMVYFFNCKAFQNWSVASIGTDLKVGKKASSHKLAAKKYIYDFIRDRYYLIYKVKEPSAPKNIQILHRPRLVGVDTSYNFYYGTPIPKTWEKGARKK